MSDSVRKAISTKAIKRILGGKQEAYAFCEPHGQILVPSGHIGEFRDYLNVLHKDGLNFDGETCKLVGIEPEQVANLLPSYREFRNDILKVMGKLYNTESSNKYNTDENRTYNPMKYDEIGGVKDKPRLVPSDQRFGRYVHTFPVQSSRVLDEGNTRFRPINEITNNKISIQEDSQKTGKKLAKLFELYKQELQEELDKANDNS